MSRLNVLGVGTKTFGHVFLHSEFSHLPGFWSPIVSVSAGNSTRPKTKDNVELNSDGQLEPHNTQYHKEAMIFTPLNNNRTKYRKEGPTFVDKISTWSRGIPGIPGIPYIM